jgi:hypothetical protein
MFEQSFNTPGQPKKAALHPHTKLINALAGKMAGDSRKSIMVDAIASCGQDIVEAISARLKAGEQHPDLVPVTAFQPGSLQVIHAESYGLGPEVLALGRLSNLYEPCSPLHDWPRNAVVELNFTKPGGDAPLILGPHIRTPGFGSGIAAKWYHVSSIKWWTLQIREPMIDKFLSTATTDTLFTHRERLQECGAYPRRRAVLKFRFPAPEMILSTISPPVDWRQRSEEGLGALLNAAAAMKTPPDDVPLADLVDVLTAFGCQFHESNYIANAAARTAARVSGTTRQEDLKNDILPPVVGGVQSQIGELHDRALEWAAIQYQREEKSND